MIHHSYLHSVSPSAVPVQRQSRDFSIRILAFSCGVSLVRLSLPKRKIQHSPLLTHKQWSCENMFLSAASGSFSLFSFGSWFGSDVCAACLDVFVIVAEKHFLASP